jgi:hypothetical protein
MCDLSGLGLSGYLQPAIEYFSESKDKREEQKRDQKRRDCQSAGNTSNTNEEMH